MAPVGWRIETSNLLPDVNCTLSSFSALVHIFDPFLAFLIRLKAARARPQSREDLDSGEQQKKTEAQREAERE